MNKPGLDKLINESKRKDERAFRLLVEEFQGLVYSLSFRLLCNEAEAEDATQETFIRVWLHLNKYDAGKKFTTWLYTITTRICLDKLKHQNRFCHHDLSEQEFNALMSCEDIEQAVINKELAAIISSITQELTPKQKITFILRYLQELSMEEIEQITNLSPDKIKSNLYLAKKTIRSRIEKLYRDE